MLFLDSLLAERCVVASSTHPTGYAGGFHRSIPLRFFEPLARVPGVRLFSIQKNDGVDQLTQIAGKYEVTDLGSRLDVDTGPFKDTAAVMTCVDLGTDAKLAGQINRVAGMMV